MPSSLVLGALVAGVAATILAIITMIGNHFVLQRQMQVLALITRVRADLRQLAELGQLDRQSLAYLQEQDQTITQHVNEGFRRLERELRLHTGSNLLHSGGRPDVP